MKRIERDSPCKVNLLLNILGKRPDGFHELETIMHPVALFDSLQFERSSSPGVELSCNLRELPCDANNLVWRAASNFLMKARIGDGVRIRLEKRIPLAAGLGGGSGNAASTLLALNELFGGPLGAEQLQETAAALGSDVPFFLQPFPALATGRGEQVKPLGKFAALEGAYILLIHPGFGVSTAWAYQALAAFADSLHGRRGRAAELAAILQEGTLEKAGQFLFNSLEAPVLRKYPVLALYQEYLRAQGAAATLMSGSGSTTFALVESERAASELAHRFKKQFGEACWTAVAAL